ncbi:MAG: DUF4199 domain-containing protein [Balneolaceae bacterium]|nr:DUF4199 domain-containing protein [Balneolaceae bacterium]
MNRIIWVYGSIAGAIVIGIIIGSMLLFGAESAMAGSAWLGYLIMIISLSLIFFGVKNYRDEELGGVIGFGKAFLVGLGIAAVAGLVYTGIWEIYLQASGHNFIDTYVEIQMEQLRESGATGETIAMEQEKMEQFSEMYQNPLFRLAITFMEIFPVGLIIALISAALLRKSEFLPAGPS